MASKRKRARERKYRLIHFFTKKQTGHRMIEQLIATGKYTRAQVYAILSDYLDKPAVHFSDLTEAECNKALALLDKLLSRYYNQLEKRRKQRKQRKNKRKSKEQTVN